MNTEIEISVEKKIELLTQITAGLLASGHFTEKPDMYCESKFDNILRRFYQDDEKHGGGYTGPYIVVLTAVDILEEITYCASKNEDDD